MSLHYEVSGKGKTVVFIHGFMENGKIWTPFVPIWSATHQVVIIDLTGHGRSPQTNSINTMENFADEVIQVLQNLQIEQATFIGHSMGGYVALAITDIYPHYVEKLVLVNSTTLPDTKAKKEQRLKVIPTVQRNLSLFVRLSIPMLFSEELKPHLQTEMETLKAIALETSIEGIEASLKGMRDRPDRTAVLYDWHGPILIINGSKDQTIDVDLFETVIPSSPSIKSIRLDTGHVSFMENKDVFTKVLLDFI